MSISFLPLVGLKHWAKHWQKVFPDIPSVAAPVRVTSRHDCCEPSCLWLWLARYELLNYCLLNSIVPLGRCKLTFASRFYANVPGMHCNSSKLPSDYLFILWEILSVTILPNTSSRVCKQLTELSSNSLCCWRKHRPCDPPILHPYLHSHGSSHYRSYFSSKCTKQINNCTSHRAVCYLLQHGTIVQRAILRLPSRPAWSKTSSQATTLAFFWRRVYGKAFHFS